MTRPAILLVEDDETLRVALADNLEHEGYEVVTATRAREATERAASRPFELVILDLMLPDGDGYGVCRELRRRGDPARVLMLTARSLEDDFVKGFEAGADDYVAKPYRLRELLARVKALLRRAGAAPETLAFAGFMLDSNARALADRAGRPIELTRTEFDLLALFVRNRNRALSRDAILDAVWGADVVVDTRTVDNFVLSLRRKLAWSEAATFRFKALRGVGYRMEIDE